jgi:histone H3/H4
MTDKKKTDKVKEKQAEGEDDEDENLDLPFPNAPVVRLIKEHTGSMMIRSKVKEEMNLLLGRICEDIAKRMAKMPYAYLGYSEFKEAAKPYLQIGLDIQEKKRLVAGLKKIKEEAAAMALEIEADMSEEDKP